MSEHKCQCAWCKKNISAEEATKLRIDFVAKVFQLTFATFFTISIEEVDKAYKELEMILQKFFKEQETDLSDLIEPIVNICFYAVGLNKTLTPWNIAENCNKIHNAIINAFKVLHVDLNVTETPILNKQLTPKMFTDHELGKAKLPQELLDLYRKNSELEMEQLAESLQSRLGEVLNGSNITPTTLH